MRIGVFFDGFSSTAEMLEISRRAEAAGAESLWFAQHMGYRDAIVWATAAALATRSVALVPTAISPYLWQPLPVAVAMATLGEIAPGRARLAVSVGNLLNLAESGGEPVAPPRVMREYVEALRTLHGGEAVHREGRIHRLRGAKMAFDAGPPYPRKLAFLFRSRGHAENIKSSGLDIDHDGIIACLKDHDLAAATRLMPAAAANSFAVAGTPAECSERLAEYLAVGLDEPIIEVDGSAEERALALDVVRDVAQR
jgi:alkanesulfonate monooxygenase SsuD/methylene tetrahydromethanopterin reductase-like flavin-dependent oxidoreductase (luciferase family)